MLLCATFKLVIAKLCGGNPFSNFGARLLDVSLWDWRPTVNPLFNFSILLFTNFCVYDIHCPQYIVWWQRNLCPFFQCHLWHSFPQYLTLLHFAHVNSAFPTHPSFAHRSTIRVTSCSRIKRRQVFPSEVSILVNTSRNPFISTCCDSGRDSENCGVAMSRSSFPASWTRRSEEIGAFPSEPWVASPQTSRWLMRAQICPGPLGLCQSMPLIKASTTRLAIPWESGEMMNRRK